MPIPLRQGSLYNRWSPLAQPNMFEPVEVDWGHPLSAGLIGCYLPTAIRPAGAGLAPTLLDISGVGPEVPVVDGASTMSYGPAGYCANGNGTFLNGTGWQVIARANQRPTSTVSLFTRVYVQGSGNLGSVPSIIGCLYNTANTAPYDCWELSRPPTAANAQFDWNVGGTQGFVTAASVFTTGSIVNLGATLSTSGVAGDAAVYVNGVVNVTGTPSSGSISYQANSTIVVNGKTGTDANTGLNTACGYIWNKKLSAQEMAWLNAEPYIFLRPARRRRLVMPSASAPSGQPPRVMVLA